MNPKLLDDIDGLMEKYEVEALYLQGKSLLKPDLYYMSRFLTVDDLYFVKLLNQPGILAAPDMVCERAKRYSPQKEFYSLSPTLNKSIQDRVSSNEYVKRVMVELEKNLLPENGVVGVPRDTDALHIHFMQKLGVNIQPVQDLFFEARETKNDMEIKAIEEASRATEATFKQVVEVLQNTDIGSKKVLFFQNAPLTVGRLKQKIEHSLVDNGSENSEDSIVVSGRKGADFHYLGLRDDLLYANEPIIIDIFPRRIEERYHADITRTIVRGQVSKEALKLFEAVESVLDAVTDAVTAGATAEELVNVMVDSFERNGHASANRTPEITEGMLHSLGHGIGLAVHEYPKLALRPTPIRPGAVIAVEPALYYKKVGGIRIENDIIVTKKGARTITKLPKTIFL